MLRFRYLAVVTLTLAAAGCGGGSSDNNTVAPPTPVLTTVNVTLPSNTLQVGLTETASAAGLDQNGSAIGVGTVTWSSTNTSVATVSAVGLVTAVAAGTTTIVATSGTKSGAATLTVTAAGTGPTSASLTLASAGQSATFLTSPQFSSTLAVQAGSQYLIAIVNTDTAYTSFEGFTLSGSLAASGGAAAVVPRALRPSVSAPRYAISNRTAADIAALRRAQRTHMALLAGNRQLFARLGNPSALRARAQIGRTAQVSAAVSQSVGSVNKVYVLKGLTLGSSSIACTNVDSIGARTVAVGQHVIVLADTNRAQWPDSLRPDSSYYQTFANEYDQVTWPQILADIGNPLAYDASLSHVGKVTVTITPVLNNFTSGTSGSAIVAFTNGCDFFPTQASGPNADYSNETEMFYSWVPGSSGFTVADWEAGLRATAPHETKHLVSYTDRIINDSPVFEDIWLEEGLAQVSAEIWERNFNEATWKGNAGFDQTVGCELDLGSNEPCDEANTKPLALVASHLPFFFSYVQNETTLGTEGLGKDVYADYGAGWTFARWAVDQYATSEGSFIQSLIDEPRLNGLANLSAHTGQSSQLLLVYWNLATAIFQTPTYTAADARTTIPSFNFANIFQVGQTGLTCGGTPCGLFTQSGKPVFPAAPDSVVGTFSKAVSNVPGTSASFFLLSNATAGVETLQLLAQGGAQLSAGSGLRVAILRVQ